MLLYGIDSVSLMTGQIRRMSVAFNTVFRRIFKMSKFSPMRIIYNFIGIKTLDCLYDERCFCLMRNCYNTSFDLLRFCSLFVSFQRDLNCKYNLHLGLSRTVWKTIYNDVTTKITVVILLCCLLAFLVF